MTPRKTIDDQMNRLMAEADASGDRGLAFAVPVARLDLANGLIGKFLGVSAAHNGMIDILFVRNPLKISCCIVGLVKVFMMHVREIFGVWNPGVSHQSGNKESLLPAISAKHKMKVPLLVGASGKKSSSPLGEQAAGFVGDQAINTPYTSKIGNFVKALVADYRFPLFTNRHAHLHFGYVQYGACQPMMQG